MESPQTFMSGAELTMMTALARNKTVLEIGTWKLGSAFAMSHEAKHVITVDAYRGDQYTGEAYTLPEAYANRRELKVEDRITLIAQDGKEVLKYLDLQKFDLIHYDADHTGAETRAALTLILAGCRQDALILVHDFESGYPQVLSAVFEVLRGSSWRVVAAGRFALLHQSIDESLLAKFLGR